jgi:large subunit ribosomal protein L10
MTTPQKVETVANLAEKMSRMQMAIVADYRGLSMAEMTELRRKLYEHGAEMVVAKNTLLLRAAHATHNEALEPLLAGPTAITFAYDNIAQVAKAVHGYVESSKQKLTVRGGLFGTTLLQENDLERIAKLPPREQLIAEILGGIQSPVSGVVGVINAVVSNVAYVLQARIDQLQPSGDVAESA